MKEIIINPDIERGFRSFEQRNVPEFTHFEVERGESLKSSNDPIVKNLLADRFQVCEVVETYYMGLRASTGLFDRHFVVKVTQGFEVALADAGFLRFRVETGGGVLLSIFTIFPDRRGRGLARLHFPKVVDALFRAGALFVHGEVGSPYPEPANSLGISKLIRFYIRTGFSHIGGTTIVKFSPYLADKVNA